MHTTTSNQSGRFRTFLETAGQTVFLIGVWWICDAATKAVGLPVPGGVVGRDHLARTRGTHQPAGA